MHYYYHFVFSGHTLQHMASEFPYQGSNTHPLPLESAVLTTPLPGKSPTISHGNYTVFQLSILIAIE